MSLDIEVDESLPQLWPQHLRRVVLVIWYGVVFSRLHTVFLHEVLVPVENDRSSLGLKLVLLHVNDFLFHLDLFLLEAVPGLGCDENLVVVLRLPVSFESCFVVRVYCVFILLYDVLVLAVLDA